MWITTTLGALRESGNAEGNADKVKHLEEQGF